MGLDHDVAIIGAGAAGMTAGIYCGRSGVRSVILDAKAAGGLTTTSPEIENYPGFPTISGPDLMANFKGHAERWCEMREAEAVTALDVRDDGVAVTTTDGRYEVGAVIMCMGADHRRLGVPGERELTGRGVSYCATCDGPFFKGKRVAQVGGGNTAALEALYLKGAGVDVTLVHRRDRLRAEETYRARLEEAGVTILFDTVVSEIKGAAAGRVEGLLLEDLVTGRKREEAFDGVFVAIGMLPNSSIARAVGVEVDASGYIKVNQRMETNVRRVYAAGDITGGMRQIINACAEGATAALSCLTVLGKAYPF